MVTDSLRSWVNVTQLSVLTTNKTSGETPGDSAMSLQTSWILLKALVPLKARPLFETSSSKMIRMLLLLLPPPEQKKHHNQDESSGVMPGHRTALRARHVPRGTVFLKAGVWRLRWRQGAHGVRRRGPEISPQAYQMRLDLLVSPRQQECEHSQQQRDKPICHSHEDKENVLRLVTPHRSINVAGDPSP